MTQWLSLSEPFVYGLVTKSGYSGVVVSSRTLQNTQAFPFEPVLSLDRLRHRVPEHLQGYVVTASLMFIAWRRSVSLVHVHHGYGAGDVIGTCRRLGLPMVLSLHGDDITGSLEEHPDLYVRVTQRVDAVIVPSRYLATVAIEAGFPEERIHVIPSGVDTTQFTPTPLPADTREVVFVGRFVEKKGLDVLLAAWPSVRRQVPDARLRLLGFGPLEHLVRSAPEGVEVILSPSHDVVRDAMRRGYVVVSPSRTAMGDSVESLLIVNLEAQASGRPLVTTRHGGIPEFVVDGETALVIPEADPGALAAALVSVLLDRDLAERLARRGPGWVRQFDAKACAERVDALYDSLLRARRRPTLSSRPR